MKVASPVTLIRAKCDNTQRVDLSGLSGTPKELISFSAMALQYGGILRPTACHQIVSISGSQCGGLLALLPSCFQYFLATRRTASLRGPISLKTSQAIAGLLPRSHVRFISRWSCMGRQCRYDSRSAGFTCPFSAKSCSHTQVITPRVAMPRFCKRSCVRAGNATLPRLKLSNRCETSWLILNILSAAVARLLTWSNNSLAAVGVPQLTSTNNDFTLIASLRTN